MSRESIKDEFLEAWTHYRRACIANVVIGAIAGLALVSVLL